MNRIAFACLAFALLIAAGPARALTNDHGVIVFTQADALAGGVTPGDTPGFPVTLSVPGASYRLGSSLTVATGANGIEVRANDVAIDMSGFTLAGSGVGRNGITSFNRNLRVANGQVRGFINDGIRTIALFLSVEKMVVTANGRYGVHADIVDTNDLDTVSFASVVDSKVTNNGADGVRCWRQCRVENSFVSSNGGNGITFVALGWLALGNAISLNAGYGIYATGSGGAGNNFLTLNTTGSLGGAVIHMQPNACNPPCIPPSP